MPIFHLGSKRALFFHSEIRAIRLGGWIHRAAPDLRHLLRFLGLMDGWVIADEGLAAKVEMLWIVMDGLEPPLTQEQRAERQEDL